MSLPKDKELEIHRGHAEARKALNEWLDYIRCRSNAVVKDWAGCEAVNPERLAIPDRVNHYGDNVVSFKRDLPSLDSLDQQPTKSFSFELGCDHLKQVMSDINKVVYEYFYSPASVISYNDFCNALEQIKVMADSEADENQATSPYKQERDLVHCHYSFIYAGWGKLEGDVDQGISIESPESIESAVMLLAAIHEKMTGDKASTFFRQKILAAQTYAQDMQARMAGVHNLPSLSRSPSK
ncbi:MAG: hypothetical protein P1U63_08220 [Coxiellaceae bacterium]|nr:hypothetical protein [Coxiellaceae bacterium]